LTKGADASDAIPTVVLVHGAFADASEAFADAVLEVAGAK
jgi:hypothetical protein